MLRLVLIGTVVAAAASAGAVRGAVVVHNAGEIEYAEITVEQATNLRGWTLVSVKGEQKFQLPALQVAAGRAVRVVSGATPVAPGDIQWTRRNVWNNNGDNALVLDSTGAIVAQHTYGAASTRGTSPAKAASAKGTKTKR